MLENKNILVTGATGFIGYHLAKQLVHHNSVYCLVRETSHVDKLQQLSGVKFIYYTNNTLGLIDALNGIKFDLVYHLASLFIAEHKTEQIEDLIDSNIKFPLQLLEALSVTQQDIKLINTGTAWQNYDASDYNPTCLYAATKQSFEDVIKFYYEARELSCITLRLYDSYGPKDERKKLFWLLNNLKETGNSLDMSPGEQKLNIIHIDDIVDAFKMAGEILISDKKINSIFGVYADEEYSLQEVVKIFESVNSCSLNINWGKREYRARELMQPQYHYPRVPNWEPQVKLNDGLKSLIA